MCGMMTIEYDEDVNTNQYVRKSNRFWKAKPERAQKQHFI